MSKDKEVLLKALFSSGGIELLEAVQGTRFEQRIASRVIEQIEPEVRADGAMLRMLSTVPVQTWNQLARHVNRTLSKRLGRKVVIFPLAGDATGLVEGAVPYSERCVASECKDGGGSTSVTANLAHAAGSMLACGG